MTSLHEMSGKFAMSSLQSSSGRMNGSGSCSPLLSVNFRILKLTLKSGEQLPDPFILPDDDWSDDIANLPDISWRDVTDYLIDSPSIYTKERMKAYKSLEAYDFFICGHVQDCLYHEISPSNDFCFIKTEVRFIFIF